MSPTRQKRSNAFAELVPALALLTVSTLTMGWLEYRPVDPHAPLLVWFSPRLDADATFAAAAASGGRIVARGPLPFTIVMQSDDPGFSQRLHRAGAWLMLDASGRGGCLSLFSRT